MSPSFLDQQITERVGAIENLIRQRADREVTLIAVTKGFTIKEIDAAKRAGIVNFGENYAQEMKAKNPDVEDEYIWHFIGQLQSNKVRQISHMVEVWHSVTSMKLAKEIEKRSEFSDILLQVNMGSRGNDLGIDPSLLPVFLEQLQGMKVNVRGLMTMGVAGDLESTRKNFTSLRRLADIHELPDCSMGMSGDLEIALECGTTMLRVGTGIFGNRST